jgi:hypothetical protein
MLLVVAACNQPKNGMSAGDRARLGEALKKLDSLYDPQEKMLTRKLTGWNYHTDATSGTFHEVRGSLSYAAKLLDYGGKDNRDRAFDIMDKVIGLQDTVVSSRTLGVWPYYEEEPLATKKSPPDFNWADFNGVTLLDIWIDHEEELPNDLKAKIKNALILAARSIEKRNMGPGYTNIAIMGTYVTYVTSGLFGLTDMHDYAEKRLRRFYDYTLERNGFTEYNSPTYTMVALDELNRMQRHITDAAASRMIDSLYAIGWDVVARHFHKPSGQWVGPHSRAYSPLTSREFYGVLEDASDGKIVIEGAKHGAEVKIKHHIPSYLLHYFTEPTFPRTESDVFAIDSPRILATAYLTDDYALSTVNRSSLWNQRHPMMAYWGTVSHPSYFQVRFLHDFYDFSSASFYSMQRENKALAVINFILGGGDKHISIDRLKVGRFQAEDLRLRFEFGPHSIIEGLRLPHRADSILAFTADKMPFYLNIYRVEFGDLKARWETGRDDDRAWIDLVLYSGKPRQFDLTKITKGVLGFALSIGDAATTLSTPEVIDDRDTMQVNWDGLEVRALTHPVSQPPNL